jgi:hypothetical protein
MYKKRTYKIGIQKVLGAAVADLFMDLAKSLKVE